MRTQQAQRRGLLAPGFKAVRVLGVQNVGEQTVDGV